VCQGCAFGGLGSFTSNAEPRVRHLVDYARKREEHPLVPPAVALDASERVDERAVAGAACLGTWGRSPPLGDQNEALGRQREQRRTVVELPLGHGDETRGPREKWPEELQLPAAARVTPAGCVGQGEPI
jgi:hypothetical protein